jgi:hypothetical protein
VGGLKIEGIAMNSESCFVCGKNGPGLQEHHLIPGTANRANSEQYGLKVILCAWCHLEVHATVLSTVLRNFGQRYFESNIGDRTEFMRIFGKNFLVQCKDCHAKRICADYYEKADECRIGISGYIKRGTR